MWFRRKRICYLCQEEQEQAQANADKLLASLAQNTSAYQAHTTALNEATDALSGHSAPTHVLPEVDDGHQGTAETP